MEIKTVKIERNYYIADDGKRFEHEDECIAYERRALLGVKEIEDTTFLKLYLDIDKDSDDNEVIPYIFTANPNYSMLDYYFACQMDKKSYDFYKLGIKAFDLLCNKYEAPEYLKKDIIDDVQLIPGKKYILLYHKYGGEHIESYGYDDCVILDELDRVIEYTNTWLNNAFYLNK